MPPIERKNIEDFTPAELAAYEHAMRILMGSTNPLENYKHHADYHNVMSSNPPRGCEHRNDLFLPWHRYHLYNFERALQATDPNHATLSTRNVTIPYWDWSVAPRHGIRYPAAFENNTSPLWNEDRNAVKAEPFYSTDKIDDIIRENPDWNMFAGGPKGPQQSSYGALEQPAHNEMHSFFVGGPMGSNSTAAEDPIYWSFHAFIDRIFARWQRIHQHPITCQQCVLRGFDNAPTANSVRNTEDLGYFYAFSDTEIAPALIPHIAVMAESAELHGHQPPASSGTLVYLWPGPATFTYPLPRLDHRPTRANLWLIDLSPPVGASFRLSAFIHPVAQPVNPDSDNFRRNYFAGDFVFWMAHHLSPGETAGAFIPITDTLARTFGASEPYQLTLISRVLPARQGTGHGGHHHEEHTGHTGGATERLQFRSILIQLDGTTAPNIRLGGPQDHGR